MASYQYDTEVNKGDINMRALAASLNRRGEDGWRLCQAFPQNDNTILIFEKSG